MDVKNCVINLTKVAFVILLGISVPEIGAKAIYSAATLTNEKFTEPLQVYGTLTATGITAPSIEVYGATTLKKCTLGSATIMGPLTSEDSTFSGNVHVEGNVSDTGSTFKQPLDLKGPDLTVTLSGTKTKDMALEIVKQGVTVGPGFIRSYFSSKKAKEPTVTLQGKTVVDGTITFNDGTPGAKTVPFKADTDKTGTRTYTSTLGKVILENKAKVTGNILSKESEVKEIEKKEIEQKSDENNVEQIQEKA